MNQESINFICSITDSPQPFPHFWKHTVGSGHATLALRADWQKQLSRCHTELGFKHVRFHGVLSDDMGTLVNEDDKLVYSFFNADQICDFLLSIGMRPFMELSFMPLALASGNDIVFHYKGNVTPPRDYKEWETLIYTLVKHWVDRYGISEVSHWFFEIWNEPNLSAFWKSTKTDYFRLYQHAARAIKKVDNALQVGGPATAHNAWITDFLNFCKKHKVPADFISTHHYPTDDFGKPGDDTIAQLAESKRSVLREEVAKTKTEAGDKPVYYTEWSTSSNPFDDLHDMPYAAAFITKTVMEAQGYVNCYSYWTFSDIFEENYFSSIPFHGGFGLLNIYGIPKPSYRAYQLLSGIGELILPVSGTHPTADIWITIKPGALKLLITNWALPRHPIKTEMIRIHLKNVGKILSSFVERIDDTHANARQTWLEMGQPSSLTPYQVNALELASSFVKEQIHIIYEEKSAFIEIAMPPQGTACITLEIE
jgi:xylan 1,4-beta-xylosidase